MYHLTFGTPVYSSSRCLCSVEVLQICGFCTHGLQSPSCSEDFYVHRFTCSVKMLHLLWNLHHSAAKPKLFWLVSSPSMYAITKAYFHASKQTLGPRSQLSLCLSNRSLGEVSFPELDWRYCGSPTRILQHLLRLEVCEELPKVL